jgi:hypothetical protein
VRPEARRVDLLTGGGDLWRPDRVSIKLEWIQRVIDHPEREVVQADGRIRRRFVP